MTPPLERRREEWMKDVADALRRLAEKHRVDLAGLSDRPEFVDAAVTATLAAIRTSSGKKREALRNAVLNSALGTVDASQQQIFLAMTERFSDRHLVLLSLFASPGTWRDESGRSIHDVGKMQGPGVLLAAFADAQENPWLYDAIWSDLFAAGLVRTPKIDNGLEGGNIKRATEFGKRYLAFISSPIDP